MHECRVQLRTRVSRMPACGTRDATSIRLITCAIAIWISPLAEMRADVCPGHRVRTYLNGQLIIIRRRRHARIFFNHVVGRCSTL